MFIGHDSLELELFEGAPRPRRFDVVKGMMGENRDPVKRAEVVLPSSLTLIQLSPQQSQRLVQCIRASKRKKR